MLPNGSSKNSKSIVVFRRNIGEMVSSFSRECWGKKNKPTKIRIWFPFFFQWKDETSFPIEKDKNSRFFPVFHEKHFSKLDGYSSKMCYSVIFSMEKWPQKSSTLRFQRVFLNRNIFILVLWKIFIFQFRFYFSSLFILCIFSQLYDDGIHRICYCFSMHDQLIQMNSTILNFN